MKNGVPIRVLFLNDHLGFSDGVIHGPARYFLNVLPGFEPSRVKPTLCILRNWHPFASQLEAAGVKPIFLGRRKWDPRVLSDLVQLVNKLDIEVVHMAGMKGCLLGRIAARITRRHSIVHLRDINPVGPLIRFLQRRLAQWTDVALAVSEPVGTVAVGKFGISKERVELLYNPIDVSRFSKPTSNTRDRIRREFGITHEVRVMGIIGRISHEKGHKLLIEALHSLLLTCPDVVLLVVGDGPTRREAEALVKRLKLDRAVRFTGYRSDIADILTALDLLVMPSIREGFPNAALEALAAGKPVVGFRVGGLPEMVKDGQTGFLVAPGDTVGLVDVLLRILTDPELGTRYSVACRDRAQRFNLKGHVQRLQEIYKGLAR